MHLRISGGRDWRGRVKGGREGRKEGGMDGLRQGWRETEGGRDRGREGTHPG